MNKILIGVLVAIAILIVGFFALNSFIYNEKQAYTPEDYKDAEYTIEGRDGNNSRTFEII